MTARPESAVVTGCNGAIGQAICNELSASGYRVIGLDRHAQSTVVEHYIGFDLATLAAEESRADSLADALAPLLAGSLLKVLVNNAAVQRLGPFENLSLAHWTESLAVNLIAPAVLAKALLSELERAHGSVINISSIHATQTKPGFAAYATTKAALSGLTRAMAVDLGARVRVNAVCPAAIDTEMLRAGFAEDAGRLEDLAACHPSGRIGTPHEVAQLVAYLASEAAGFVSGACLAIDGGISSRLHDPK